MSQSTVFNPPSKLRDLTEYYIGAATKDASAVHQADSTAQGSLWLPRMTTAQRAAIASPATGLEVYNTDLRWVETYDGAQWRGQMDSFHPLHIPGCQMFGVAEYPLLFTDAARTTKVESVADVIGGAIDKSMLGRHGSQATAGKRPPFTIPTGFGRPAKRGDGATGHHLDFGNICSFERTDSFTQWVVAVPTAAVDGMAIAKQENGGDYRGYNLVYLSSRKWALGVSNQSGNEINAHGSTVTTLDTLQSVVGTYSGTSLTSGCRIYVNSAVPDTLTAVADNLSATIVNAVNLRTLTRDGDGVKFNGWQYAWGIWTGALTAHHAAALHRWAHHNFRSL